jgi:hypothetical protein
VTREIRLYPDPLAAYRSLRADTTNELGKRVKDGLQRLRDDPGAARAYRGRWTAVGLWSLPVSSRDGMTWLILWRETPADVVEVLYIGPAPGESSSGPAWTSETDTP